MVFVAYSYLQYELRYKQFKACTHFLATVYEITHIIKLRTYYKKTPIIIINASRYPEEVNHSRNAFYRKKNVE